MAALSVLFFHSRIFSEGSLFEIPLQMLFSNGWMGVDVFFVLSGFVISYVYADRVEYRNYLVRRFARFYPVYILTTLLALGIVTSLGKPPFSQLGDFDILMNIAMLQGLYGGHTISVNFVSWSVSAEFIIYLIFPIIFWIGAFLPANLFGVLTPIILYSAFGGLDWTGLGWPVNKCLFLFSAGVMLFNYWVKNGSSMPKWISGAAIISLVAILGLPSWARQFGINIHNAQMAVFAVPIVAWGLTWHPKSALILLGGRISYSIYLFHGVVYMYLVQVQMVGEWLLFIFSSLIIAYVGSNWIERPARKWILVKSVKNNGGRQLS